MFQILWDHVFCFGMGLSLDHQVSFASDPWVGMKPDSVT